MSIHITYPPGSTGGGESTAATTHVADATLTAPAGRSRHIGNTAGGNIDLGLPAAAGADVAAEIVIAKLGAANTLTITPSGAETINGAAGVLSLTENGEFVALWPVTGGWVFLSQTPLYA